MSGNELISKVRRALHIADSIHSEDAALVEQLLKAAERCRDAQRDLLSLVEQARPNTIPGEHARTALLQHIREMDCGEKLLGEMFSPSERPQAQIYTETPPDQLQ